MSDEKPRATLSDRQARGGVIGGKGYGFQAAYIVSRIPIWLNDPDFAQFLQEGAGDVDVRFNRADGEERWYVQVKNYAVTPATAHKVFSQFRDTDAGTPGTYTHFTLACPGLNEDLKRLRSAVEELRGAKDFYRPGQDPILDNTRADLKSLVERLDLPVDAAFLVDKVDFDTDLAGLTDDASLRRLFVGTLIELDAWARVPPGAAARAYEKLALLCHQALRQTCSREHVEALIQEAVGELPVEVVHFLVPFIRNPDFVGREEDLERLHQALSGEGPVGIRPAGLTGMGGIGKTQLAVEYAYRYAEAYPDGVFWINATEPLAQGFAQLGRRLYPATVDRSLDEQILAAVRYLRDHTDALVILDNLADPADLNRPISADVVPGGLPCRILFTTRRRDLGRFHPIEVTVLPEDTALKLLLRHPSRRGILGPTHPEHEEAQVICAVLGYLPLALEVAATHLGRRSDAPLAAYRQELLDRGALPVLDDPRLLLRSEDLPTRHDAAVAATLASQWETLENEDARLLLRVAGQLPEAAMIPTARLGLLAGLDDREDGFFGSPLTLALQVLKDASLVEELREGQVRLHPLVREFAAGRTPKEETPAFHRWCATNLTRTYEDFASVEDHCADRGVEAVEEDLAIALDWAPRTPEESVSLRRLESLLYTLQWESSNLRDWDREQYPNFLAQQVYNRAVMMGEAHWVNEVLVRLEQLQRPYLKLLWCSGDESVRLPHVLQSRVTVLQARVVTPFGLWAVSIEAEADATEAKLRAHASDESQYVHSGVRIRGKVNRPTKHWNLVIRLSNLPEHIPLFEYDQQVGEMQQDSRFISVSIDHLSINEEDVFTSDCAHFITETLIAVAQDGNRVVSTSRNGPLKVWNLQTGNLEYALSGHSAPVTDIALTSDGVRAVSASVDRTLKVWDLQVGQEEHTLCGHKRGVSAVLITPNNREAISASADNTLKVWDLKTGQVVHTLSGHSDTVYGVALTPDGQRVVSASWDGTLIVWNLKTGRKDHILRGHEGPVNAVAVTPDGQRAVSVSEDSTLMVWNLRTGHLEQTLGRHKKAAYFIAVTPDGHRAISTSEDGTLGVWNLEMHSLEQMLSSPERESLSRFPTKQGSSTDSGTDKGPGYLDIAMMCAGRLFATTTWWDNKLKVWSIEPVNVRSETVDLRTDIHLDRELAVAAFGAELSRITALSDGVTIVAGDGVGDVYCLQYVEGNKETT